MYVRFEGRKIWHRLREDGTLQCRAPITKLVISKSDKVPIKNICATCLKKRKYQNHIFNSESPAMLLVNRCPKCSSPLRMNPVTRDLSCPDCRRRYKPSK